jgi:cyclic-di-GMP phosphodiesterase, flagellum assembly factor TipF
MTRQFAKSQPLHERFGDVFVILSVTLLSLACGAAFIARLGLDLSSALVASLAIYCGLLLFHLLMRRSLREPAEDHLADDGDADGDPDWQHDPTGERFEATLSHGGAPAPADEYAPPPSQPGTWPEPLPMPDGAHANPDPSLAPSGLYDPFNFRPTRSPYFEEEGAEPHTATDAPHPRAEAEAQAPPPEMNVELIQDLIKKLADELNGAPPASEANAPAMAPPAPAPTNETEAMIGRSVAALEATVRTMRGASEAPLDTGTGPASGFNPAAPARRPGARAAASLPLDPKLARIAEAISSERIEVLLQPIHALSEGRPRHYEVSVRLRMADGGALDQSEFSRMAHGSGLMPRIDAARMLRAARVARRLGERGRQGSVLTALTGESLTDEAFLDAAALQAGTDGRISLVLSFTQNDVRTFTPVHAEALGSMAAGGFGFALEDVTDLNMDFGALKAMGFEFIKLDAPVFLEGLPTAAGRIPASDICRYLSEFGLTLIVGRIEDDWLLARILGFGVLLGNGTLFGAPKLVKPEIVSDRGAAAA